MEERGRKGGGREGRKEERGRKGGVDTCQGAKGTDLENYGSIWELNMEDKVYKK